MKNTLAAEVNRSPVASHGRLGTVDAVNVRDGDGMESKARWQDLQSSSHGEGFDYVPGSPHLNHPELRNHILDQIGTAIKRQFDLRGRCRVLEIGAGHGTFSQVAASLGAEATITEMSHASANELRRRFAGAKNITVLHDADGEAVFERPDEFDLVLYISVIHHIPDYIRHIQKVVEKLSVGADVVTFQDPTWFPRRRKVDHYADKVAYLTWRLTQGNITQGLSSMARRARGIYDESNASDMVEYHVVRQGVDEQALLDLFKQKFEEVALRTYWSSQGRVQQRLGSYAKVGNTFGLTARSRC